MARHLQGSCRRDLSKGGLEAHAIRCPAGDCRQLPRGGRSTGGLTTKIHAAVDALEGVGHVIADAGYDADHLRDFIAAERGAVAQIKQNPTRSGSKLIDWALYKERNLVERFLNRIKRFRRIALRCEKTAAAFQGFVALACAMAWLA